MCLVYVLDIIQLTNSNNKLNYFLDKSKAEINATFDGVHTKDSSYDVFVAAISTGGTEVAFLHNANLSYTEILGKRDRLIN